MQEKSAISRMGPWLPRMRATLVPKHPSSRAPVRILPSPTCPNDREAMSTGRARRSEKARVERAPAATAQTLHRPWTKRQASRHQRQSLQRPTRIFLSNPVKTQRLLGRTPLVSSLATLRQVLRRRIRLRHRRLRRYRRSCSRTERSAHRTMSARQICATIHGAVKPRAGHVKRAWALPAPARR